MPDFGDKLFQVFQSAVVQEDVVGPTNLVSVGDHPLFALVDARSSTEPTKLGRGREDDDPVVTVLLTCLVEERNFDHTDRWLVGRARLLGDKTLMLGDNARM